MKFLHISDLHIGKNDFYKISLMEDQKFILQEIIRIIKNGNFDGVLIAGDVYHQAVPPIEAVKLFDEFLFQLFELNTEIFIIGGNHDSQERLSFGSRLIDKSGIHIATKYDGNTSCFTLCDKFGEVNVYLLPFVNPTIVRAKFPEKTIKTHNDAVKIAIQNMNIDTTKRNILIAHQFVTNSDVSESEDSFFVGGIDNVDVSVFDDFDYIALGHLHKPQNCPKNSSVSRIRYCGTPLKYSFSEADDEKSVTVVELNQKGNLEVSTVSLPCPHELHNLKGTFQEISSEIFYSRGNFDCRNDYFHITLTDECDIYEAMSLLRKIYPNLLKFDYDNTRTRKATEKINDIKDDTKIRQNSIFELFSDFYYEQNKSVLDDCQKKLVLQIIERIKENDNETN